MNKNSRGSVQVVFGQTPGMPIPPLANGVVTRTFGSEKEEKAYMLGLSDAEGHLHSRVLDQSKNVPRVLTVHVIQTQGGSPDSDAVSCYSVEVSNHLSNAQAASAALDGIALHVPMDSPEHFDIEVYDEQGRALLPDATSESYAHAEYAYKVEKLGDLPLETDDEDDWVDCFCCKELVPAGTTLASPNEGEFCQICVGQARVVLAENGKKFYRQPDDSWTDGENTFASLGDFTLAFLIMADDMSNIFAGPSEKWQDKIFNMKAVDWMLYTGEPGVEDVASTFSHRLVTLLEQTLDAEESNPERHINRPDRARNIRELMYTNMDEYEGMGARDSEPEGVLVKLINEVLGTDIWRWD